MNLLPKPLHAFRPKTGDLFRFYDVTVRVRGREVRGSYSVLVVENYGTEHYTGELMDLHRDTMVMAAKRF